MHTQITLSYTNWCAEAVHLNNTLLSRSCALQQSSCHFIQTCARADEHLGAPLALPCVPEERVKTRNMFAHYTVCKILIIGLMVSRVWAGAGCMHSAALHAKVPHAYLKTKQFAQSYKPRA